MDVGTVAGVTNFKESAIVESREKHLTILSEYGADIVKGMIQVSDKYYQICLYIRKHSVEDDIVRDALEPLGFIKQRITELCRVAKSSESLWSEFEARKLSFRRTLELTRGTVQLLLAEKVEENAWVADVPTDHEVDGSGGQTERAEGRENLKDKLEAGVHRVALLAEKLNMRGKTYQLENGWSVKIFKTKAVKSHETN